MKVPLSRSNTELLIYTLRILSATLWLIVGIHFWRYFFLELRSTVELRCSFSGCDRLPLDS